jgi:hypothetical protein
MMQWEPTISYYSEYWDSLENQLKDSLPVLPKITKALPIIKWAEAFGTYLARVHGARSVTREKVAVKNLLPVLVTAKSYSLKYGSAKDELVALTSHTSGLYRINNAEVYYAVDLATQGTTYASSVTPFSATKDGRGDYLAATHRPIRWP